MYYPIDLPLDVTIYQISVFSQYLIVNFFGIIKYRIKSTARPRSGKTNRRKARAGGKRGGGEKGSARPSPQSIRIGVLLEKSSNIIQ